jgi:hypothetical protein
VSEIKVLQRRRGGFERVVTTLGIFEGAAAGSDGACICAIRFAGRTGRFIPSFEDWAALAEGAYLLRSNIGDWSDHELWKAYIQLTQAEAAFRIQKDRLNLRPIWHQREDRVQAHILVCFLAFALWKSLEMWQQRAGLGNSPRTLLEELARIQSHDVVRPTATHGEIRLRCVAQPDAAQGALLDRLGIVLPKRMRPPDNESPTLALTA